MNRKFLPIILISFLLSCSKDDEVSISDNLIVIQESDNIIYEIDQSGTILNEVIIDEGVQGKGYLSVKLNYTSDYISYVTNDLIENKLSVWQLNLNSLQVTQKELYTAFEEQILQSISSDQYVAILIDDFSGSVRKEIIAIVDIKTKEIKKIDFGEELDFPSGSSRLSLTDEYLFFYGYEDLNTLKLYKIGLETGNILDSYILNENSSVSISDKYVYEFYYNGDRKYNKINMETFEIEESGGFPLSSNFPSFGFHSTKFNGDQMLTLVYTPQPSPIASIPAIWDFSQSKSLKPVDYDSFYELFIHGIYDEISPAEQHGLDARYKDYDIRRKRITLSYREFKSSYETINGGFILTDFDAQILHSVSLGFEPEIIFMR